MFFVVKQVDFNGICRVLNHRDWVGKIAWHLCQTPFVMGNETNQKLKGYLLGAIAAATYGMNPLFAKPLYENGLSMDTVLFYRYVMAVPVIALMIKLRGRSFKLQRKAVFPLIVMGVLLSISSLTLFYSYTYMDAGLASTLLFIYPVLVAVIMAVVFKEKISRQTVICIIMALAGIVLLSRGSDGKGLNPIGVAIVMVSSVTYAIYLVAVNQWKVLKEMPTVQLTFYALLFSTVILFGKTGFGMHLQPITQWYEWLLLLCLAILPTVVSFLATTQAIHYIGPTPTAILGSLEPLTAVVFGVLVFHEVFTSRLVLGMLLIITAVTIIVSKGNFATYLLRFRKLFPKLKKK